MQSRECNTIDVPNLEKLKLPKLNPPIKKSDGLLNDHY